MTPQDQQGRIEPVGGSSGDSVREQDKIMLVLAYLGILSLIPMLTVKDSEYVLWHAKQGLVFSLGGGIALVVLSAMVSWIPVLNVLVGCVGFVGFMVVDVMAMVKAVRGERWRIPVAADIAAKL